MNSELDEAISTLDDAIRIFAKLVFDHEDAICTGWVLTLAGMHPQDGEVLTSKRMPGLTWHATRGLAAYTDTAWERGNR